MDIFRKEVLIKKKPALYGELDLSLPIKWRAITILLTVSAGVSIGALILLPYAPHKSYFSTATSLNGTVGVPGEGRVDRIFVREGQTVRKGEVLFSLNNEAVTGMVPNHSGNAFLQSNQSAILSQYFERQENTPKISDIGSMRLKLQSLRDRLEISKKRIAAQASLVESAREDLSEVEGGSVHGLIGHHNIPNHRAIILERQIQLSSFISDKIEIEEHIEEILSDIRQHTTHNSTVEGERESTLKALGGEGHAWLREKKYNVTAPTSGTITAILARRGDLVNDDSSVLFIEPGHSQLASEFYIDSTDFDNVALNQIVTLRIRGQRYSRNILIRGIVMFISPSPIPIASNSMEKSYKYLVRVRILDKVFRDRGKVQSLRAGEGMELQLKIEDTIVGKWIFATLFNRG